MRIFSVYDSKADYYSKPVVEINAGVALRSFADAARGGNGENAISQHPEDYTLFELGTWDQDKGEIKMHVAKKSLGVALEYAESHEPDHKMNPAALKAVIGPNGESLIQGGE